MEIYLLLSSSNGTEMLNIKFYCKSIQYVTAWATQICQFIDHDRVCYKLRVTIVKTLGIASKETLIKKKNSVLVT